MNDMQLYNTTCMHCSQLVTNKYSTSFSLGIKLFDPTIRNQIYAIYGFVRFADEIVDSFHDYNKKELLDQFRKETFTAIASKISINPILQSFQEVVNTYEIDHQLIHDFLDSMEMDLYKSTYANHKEYDKYIYGSAEAVGLMCLQVFCKNDKVKYVYLKPYAKKLGAAFQKINFLRDIKSDYKERGRVYFPNVELSNFNATTMQHIINDIENDFNEALIGIQSLPKEAKKGVYLAYLYYVQLMNKIKKTPAQQLFEQRISVSNYKKAYLFLKVNVLA